ncbi:terminase TerL endonuclease subunit [Serratia marcescens]|uniref:terminase large subunit n=1 Tax=Serratia marcescens TaxID=615 RepID=UPI0018D92300|nr:terminase [Serratia marcescens]HAU5716760.1 terminase [Serratia marcescens]HAU5732667.1 terminase [Serratia marcescens]HAU5753233.1 terminase [Serratia marcescens]
MAKKNLTRAERNILWCERNIVIPEGKFVGQPLKMADFMKDDFRAIFDNKHSTRRAIISRGRKNAKTVETAMLMLLYLVGPEAAPNSQLYSAARSRDQAAILFNLASKMCRMNPVLMQYVAIKDSAKEIHCPELGSYYRALSAEATTAYGFSPRFVAHDELGQVRGPRDALYEALETATAAQDNPISIIISTQAPDASDLLSLLIDDGLTGADPRTVVRLQTAPEEIDPFSVEAIRLANPAFDVFMNQKEVLDMAASAKRLPSRQAEFENLVLNRRVEAKSPFVSQNVWHMNKEEPGELAGATVWGGLDLSSVSDLTALVLNTTQGDVHCNFWLPEEGLADKARNDRVPYDIWARQGFLNTTPGKAIEYAFIARELRRVFDICNVRALAFDRYNMRFLRPHLIDAGFTEAELERFVEFGQGFVSMSPALRELEAKLLGAQLKHGNHPILEMCAKNATVITDPAGNRKFVKGKSSGRIDGMVALAMSIGAQTSDEVEDPGDVNDFIYNFLSV